MWQRKTEVISREAQATQSKPFVCSLGFLKSLVIVIANRTMFTGTQDWCAVARELWYLHTCRGDRHLTETELDI